MPHEQTQQPQQPQPTRKRWRPADHPAPKPIDQPLVTASDAQVFDWDEGNERLRRIYEAWQRVSERLRELVAPVARLLVRLYQLLFPLMPRGRLKRAKQRARLSTQKVSAPRHLGLRANNVRSWRLRMDCGNVCTVAEPFTDRRSPAP